VISRLALEPLTLGRLSTKRAEFELNLHTAQLGWAALFGGIALTVSACTAAVDGKANGTPSAAGGAASSSGAGASNTQGGAGGVLALSAPGITPVRRLTHIEYNNTVADLLGDTTAPAAAFSPDVAQDGFTNNATALTVSPALTEQYLSAAEALSKAATADLVKVMGCDAAVMGEQVCAQQFIRDFGKRAWRRPLSAAESARLLAVFSQARSTLPLDVSVQLVLQVFLQSPQFIYLLEPADPALNAAPSTELPLDSWQIASRLSYFLLGSLPDAALFAEAEKGALSTPEQVAAQARRLLSLPRARDRISLFFTEWLQLRNVDRLQKDGTLFPNYSLALGPLLRQQVQLFTTSIILDKAGTTTDLLTAPYTFMSAELAPLYGVPAPSAAGFSRVDLDPTRRAGLLTHVGILASLAHANQTDPVHRGKFVRERLLCESVPPPPPNANITPPVVTADATTRQRFTQHRSNPSCAGCHALMDPIGLGFEHYDALGQWRDTDNGFPVDATGQINGSDVAGDFDGAVALAQKLAASQQVKDCFVQTWFRFAHGRSVTDLDAGNLAVLDQNFAAHAFQISELLVAMTETKSFRFQRVADPNPVAGGSAGSGGGSASAGSAGLGGNAGTGAP
jgi:hypothetical protein